MKILDKFYDYTIQENMGFKLAFGDIIVSVVSHIPQDSYEETMKGNGISGNNISFITKPKDLIAFTFGSNNVELEIFNQKTEENVTEKYCFDFNGFDEYEGILYGFTPFELVDILVRVKEDVYIQWNSYFIYR